MLSWIKSRLALIGTIAALLAITAAGLTWGLWDDIRNSGSQPEPTRFQHQSDECVELDLSSFNDFTGKDFPAWELYPDLSRTDHNASTNSVRIWCTYNAEVDSDWCESHDSPECAVLMDRPIESVRHENQLTVNIKFYEESSRNSQRIDELTDLSYYEITDEFAYGSFVPNSVNGRWAYATYSESNLRIELKLAYAASLYDDQFNPELSSIMRDLAEQVATLSEIPEDE